MKLSEAQRRNLLLLSEEWHSVHVIAGPNRRAVSGLSSALSHLASIGYAEWKYRDWQSFYRITPAGRAALRETE